MNLIFENSVAGRKCVQMPACDVPEYQLPASLTRQQAPHLPEMSETDQPPLYQTGRADLWGEQRLLSPGLLHHEIQSPDQ